MTNCQWTHQFCREKFSLTWTVQVSRPKEMFRSFLLQCKNASVASTGTSSSVISSTRVRLAPAFPGNKTIPLVSWLIEVWMLARFHLNYLDNNISFSFLIKGRPPWLAQLPFEDLHSLDWTWINPSPSIRNTTVSIFFFGDNFQTVLMWHGD